MKQTKLNRFKRILSIIFFIVVTIVCSGFNDKPRQSYRIAYIEQKTDTISIQDSIQSLIIDEMEKYIFSMSDDVNQKIPYYIATIGLENDIDLCFMMAQAEIETQYGTSGIGKESSRKSLFGVSSKRYSSYEKAIDDYCNILKRLYLKDGKTENHLMKNYVSVSGNRYAQSKTYEIKLRDAYNNIKESTDIYKLQSAWKEL